MSAVDLLCWGILGVWRRWRRSQQEPLCAVCCKTFASAQRIFRGSPVFCSGGDRDARATARATAGERCKYHWIEQCQRRDWSVTCFKLFCVPTRNVSLVAASICICCIYTIIQYIQHFDHVCMDMMYWGATWWMSRIHLTTRCRRRASVSPASPWLFFLGGEIRRLSNYWKGQSAPPNSFKVEFRISWSLVGHIGWKCWRAITRYSFKVQMISDQFSMVALFLQDEAVKLHGFTTRSRPLFARMMTSFTNSRHQQSQAKTRCKASTAWMGVVKFFRVFEGCILLLQ